MKRQISVKSVKTLNTQQSNNDGNMTANNDKTKKSKRTGGGGKVSTRKATGGKSWTTKNLVDIFNEHAMQNAYYTCHNVQDLLKNRGFLWPELIKKKKKNKK